MNRHIAVLIKFETLLVFTPLTPLIPLSKGGNELIVPLEIQGVSVSVLIEMAINRLDAISSGNKYRLNDN